MTTIENIVDCKGMITCRDQLHADIDQLISQAWRCVRVSKSKSGEYVPIFSGPEMDDIATKLEDADKKISELEADASEIAKLMEGFQSLEHMARVMNTASGAVSRAEHNVRTIMSSLIKRGLPLEDVGQDLAVVEAQLALDKVVAEHKPIADDLGERMKKAKDIIRRYVV